MEACASAAEGSDLRLPRRGHARACWESSQRRPLRSACLTHRSRPTESHRPTFSERPGGWPAGPGIGEFGVSRDGAARALPSRWRGHMPLGRVAWLPLCHFLGRARRQPARGGDVVVAGSTHRRPGGRLARAWHSRVPRSGCCRLRAYARLWPQEGSQRGESAFRGSPRERSARQAAAGLRPRAPMRARCPEARRHPGTRSPADLRPPRAREWELRSAARRHDRAGRPRSRGLRRQCTPRRWHGQSLDRAAPRCICGECPQGRLQGLIPSCRLLRGRMRRALRRSIAQVEALAGPAATTANSPMPAGRPLGPAPRPLR